MFLFVLVIAIIILLLLSSPFLLLFDTNKTTTKTHVYPWVSKTDLWHWKRHPVRRRKKLQSYTEHQTLYQYSMLYICSGHSKPLDIAATLSPKYGHACLVCMDTNNDAPSLRIQTEWHVQWDPQTGRACHSVTVSTFRHELTTKQKGNKCE